MINNLMDALTGNNFNLRQLVKILALKGVKPTDNTDCIRLKITNDDETIIIATGFAPLEMIMEILK